MFYVTYKRKRNLARSSIFVLSFDRFQQVQLSALDARILVLYGALVLEVAVGGTQFEASRILGLFIC